MVAPQNAWDRLHRAMRQLTTNEDGIWGLAITGTVNTIGGGTGGTAMVDNNPFTPGGTSITPIGGYYGGRTVSSGNAAAPAISASAILQVHVVAGGAGGGLSQLQVVGTDNSNFNNVGFPSGGSPSVNAIPVNVVAGAAGVSTVNLAGQPISVVGSQSVTQLGAPWSVIGSQGVTQLGAPWTITGSINPHGVFAPGGSLSIVGSINPVGVFAAPGSVNVFGSVSIGGPADTANSAIRVSVVAGGAGGGVAQLQVVGTDNSTWMNVGQPSGNTNLFHAIPVWGTINTVGAGGTSFASVAVYGSPAMPIYNIGSVNVVNAVGIFGSVSVVGSVGATQLGAPWTVTGSVGVTPLAAFSLGGIPQVDPRGSLVPTQWIISAGGSGQFAIAGSAPANQRIYFTGYRFVSTGTVDVQFQSPSGVAISGSLRMLPGAGMVDNGGVNWPVLVGSQQSPIFMLFTGTQNVGGWANGYIAP